MLTIFVSMTRKLDARGSSKFKSENNKTSDAALTNGTRGPMAMLILQQALVPRTIDSKQAKDAA